MKICRLGSNRVLSRTRNVEAARASHVEAERAVSCASLRPTRCTPARAAAAWSLLLAGSLALGACSSGSGSDDKRAAVLDFPPTRIAVEALSDMPSAEYANARRVVVSRLPKERVDYLRKFQLTGGRGAAIAGDMEINKARLEAASALKTTIDPLRVGDTASAQADLDALLAEVAKYNAAATSCDQLPGTKADDCALGLVIIEVKRCELPPEIDAGAPLDAGAPADTGVTDAGIAGDAGDASAPADSGPPSPITPIACGDRNVAGARMVTGSVTASDTWSGTILVMQQTRVTGATITITPGTQIYMDVDSSLEIGWNGNEATIVANGTPDAPIRFCGKMGDAGYWNKLTIGANVTSDSVLRNVLVAEAGGSDKEAALELGADITIDNVQVRTSGKDGVWASDFKADSHGLTIEDSAGTALVLQGEGALTRFPLGGGFRNNAENVARIRFTSLMDDTTAHAIGIPYLQEEDMLQRGGALTLEAGVEYRVVPGKALHIGWNGSTAGIHANGTASAPVVFRSQADNTNAWIGMTFEPNVLIDSNLTYTEIHNAGANGSPALSIESAVHVDHLSLIGNAVGMEIAKSGLAADSKNLSITQPAARPLTIDPDAIFTLPQGGSLTGNMIDQIDLSGGSAIDKSGTINNLGIPYYVTGTLRVIGGSNITIAPGTKFVMGPDSSIDVGWNGGVSSIIANGTADAHISFAGASMAAGFWYGVTLEPGVLSNSSISYVDFGQGGKSGGGELELNVDIPVSNCHFSQSAGYGITKPASITHDYTPGNTFDPDLMLGAIGAN